MRNYVMGIIYGGLLAALGLAAVSYFVPERVEMADTPVQQAVPNTPAPTNAPAPAPAKTLPSAPATDATVKAGAPQPEPIAPTPQPPAQPPALSAAPEAQAQGTAAPNPAPNSTAQDLAKTDQAAAAAPNSFAPATPLVPNAPLVAADASATQKPLEEASPSPTAADLPPLQAFAATFDGAADKPLFAVILRDIGAPGVDRAVAASLPMPITFAIDPESPFAAEAMAIYRAAGKEVIMAPTSLPKGGTLQDIETSMAAYADLLPESVAVISAPQDGFQDDLALASLVVPAIGMQGRGVVLINQGLNSASQIAQREGIAYAMVSKIIDAEGESFTVMRRYLDRALFRAAQEGAGIVMGTLQPDTLTALTEWSLEGKAGGVTLAPISALMRP